MFGASHELSRAIAMSAAWLVNLAVAELVIWRRTRRRQLRRSTSRSLRTDQRSMAMRAASR